MSLSSLQLDAFLNVAREKNFSSAAKRMGLTQPALSHRIMNLEEDLGTNVFIREGATLQLTPAGEHLLRYCLSREKLESQFLSDFKSSSKDVLAGTVRIGGFSTIMPSVVLPALSPLARQHPPVSFQFLTREVRELLPLLRQGQIDYCLNYSESPSPLLESHLVGHEENVLIRPLRTRSNDLTYLDHDADDEITFEFLKLQKMPRQKMRRSFMDDVFSLVRGVELGYGQAVVPKHIVIGNSKVSIVDGLKPLRLPVWLHFYKQPFYVPLHTAVVAALKKNILG